MSNQLYDSSIFQEIKKQQQELTSYRRRIHSQPEIDFETSNTVQAIKEFLNAKNIFSVDTEVSRGSLIAVIDGNRPGPTIALRADIDALPLQDASTNAWKSQITERCHACGHDGHQTWLLAAADYLHSHNDFPGRVVCIFQAAEESVSGAKSVVESGIFQKYDIQEVYGAHNEPFLDLGSIGFKIGALMASADYFKISLFGKGTHGARPHLGIDTFPAGTEIYQALQTIVSRNVDPLESIVLSVCSVVSGNGTSYNIIPAKSEMVGTVRTFSPAVRDFAEKRLHEIVKGISYAHNLDFEVSYNRLTGPVINDKECTEFAVKTAEELLGKENVLPALSPTMISEDFSEYEEVVPGTMFLIGVRDKEHTQPLHHPSYDFNDKVIPLAAAFFIELTVKRLAYLATKEDKTGRN